MQTTQIRVEARCHNKNAPDSTRRGEPVTFGVPLPQGVTSRTDGWTITAPDGSTAAVQVRALDRWADESIRWALVDARIDHEIGRQAAFHLKFSAPHALPASPPLRVVARENSLQIDTGAARVAVQSGVPRLFTSVEIAGQLRIDASRTLLLITDAEGNRCDLGVDSVTLEESGLLRATARLDCTIRRGGRRLLDVTVRMHFYAGLSTVRLLLCVRNPERARHRGGFWDLGDPGSVLIRELSFMMVLPKSTVPMSVRCSPEAGAPWQTFHPPFALYQDSSGGENWQSRNHVNRNREIPVSFRGYRIVSGGGRADGLRATPAVSIRQGDLSVAAAVPHFWQNFPQAIEAADSALILRFFPPQSADVQELQGGEQKTFECFVAFDRDPVAAVPLEWSRNPAIMCVDPAWAIGTGAIPFLEQLDGRHKALVDTALEGPDAFDAKREVIDEYGWRHFGEIYGDHEAVHHSGPTPLVSHYNNQYDPIAGFAYQFLRTGDRRWHRMMSELAAHVIDIDVYHTVHDKWAYNHGTFWHTYHYGDADTATHRTYPRSARGRIHGGGPSADHNYTTGLMLYYFLSGDDAARTTVLESAQFVIDIDDGRKSAFRWLDAGDTGWATRSADYFGPGRGPANSINALIDGYRLSGDPRYSRKLEQLIRRVIHPDDDLRRHQLDNTELRWFYTMFLQSLGKYLQFKTERAEFDFMYGYARDSLLHYARWMAAHEFPYLDKPQKLEFPTETWAAQDIRKSDVFLYAAGHATASERDGFLERANFFYEYSVTTLQQMPTRTRARPVVVLLTSGFLMGWMRRHPHWTVPSSEDRDQHDYGEPETFVPQKTRALRRARWIGIAAGTGLLLGALTWTAFA
jgi:hypothetical protein